MDKKSIGVMVLLVAAALILPSVLAAKPVCNDGADNDGDGLADYPEDPGCSAKNDASELNPAVECDDGVDNDGDGLADYNDAGCSGPTDNDETNCGDGVCEGGETYETCPADCPIPDSCFDTDGGHVTIQGTVSGYLNENPYSYTDFCNGTSLVEYYCVLNQPLNYPVDCAQNVTMTCLDGACVY